MFRCEEKNNSLFIKIKPLLKEKEIELVLKKPSIDAKIEKFNTATSPMGGSYIDGKPYMEHLTLDGKMELIPYEGKHAGDLNFYNAGWKYNKGRKYYRIDVYTGEHLLIEE